MGSSFNGQILVEKLAKLNNSQQSIETLSHWCIFHMNKAKQVVETWDRQFHSSPREQRLAFLYLANDILQNSRRKGSEFVGEFWKVLPDALRDVIQNGDEFGRNAALRLISIWEERKVFGSRGQILKEEFVGRHPESSNRNGKHSGIKLKQSVGNTLDKIVSSYEEVYGGQLDEDVVLSKCRNAISSVEKVEKEIGGGISSEEQFKGSGYTEELQGQHAVLRDCVEQLTVVESSRSNLVSHLREALQEQEYKLDQVRNQLRAAQSQSAQAGNICQQFLSESVGKEPHTSKATHNYTPSEHREQSAPVMYTRQVPFLEKSSSIEEDPRKSQAAAVAAKLTASTSSAQMLTYVLSSLASEGVIRNSLTDPSSVIDNPSEKRPKLDNDQSYNVTATAQHLPLNEQPPLPLSPPPPPPQPPMPPYPAAQFMHTASSMPTVPYNYGTSIPFGNPQTNLPYQSFQGAEGGFYSQASSLPMAPISRQQS